MKKILLVDDQRIMRKGLRNLLGRMDDIEVVGEAKNGKAAIKMTDLLKPDIIIMDVVMPKMNGIEATHQISSKNSSINVIALSMYAEKRLAKEMLKAGASAYVLKDSVFEELEKAIQEVLANRVYISPDIGKSEGGLLNPHN
jgi:DNA-binding NarL/FixJ family response regulator